jgi:hypothetical protein
MAASFAALFALLVVSVPTLPDSIALVPCGSYPFRGGTALALDTVLGVAYVGSGDGVLVVDVSDPEAPVVVSDAIRCEAAVKDLWLDWPRLYVGVMVYSRLCPVTRDVEIWDVSVPAVPHLLGGVDLDIAAPAVWARDSLLLCSSLRSLQSWNVSDPMTPVRLDSVSLSGLSADMVRVRDTLAFCSVWGSPVQVFNVADPTDLRLLAEWGLLGEYPGLQLADSLMFVASSYGPTGYRSGLRVYDISDPLNGRQIGAIDTAESDAYRVAVRDSLALLTHYRHGGLGVLSVADPTRPRELTQYGASCAGTDWLGSYGTVAFADRLALLNLSDPANPVEAGFCPMAWAGSDFVLAGQHAITLGSNLAVLDRAGPELERIGSLVLPGEVGLELVAASPRALAQARLTAQARLLCFIDLSDPTRPELAAADTLETSSMALAINDTIGFVGTGDSLLVLDITRLSAPTRVGRLDAPLDAQRLLLRDSLLFVAGGPDRVLNVSDPTAPTIIATLGTASHDLAVVDSVLYALGHTGQMTGYSIADPASPRRLFEFYAGGDRMHAADTLLVIGGRGSIQFYSIADPAGPVLTGRKHIEGNAGRLALVGDTLYVSALRRYLIRPLSGVAEPPSPPTGGLPAIPGLARGTLLLPGRSGALLHDISGRKVMELQPGENDVRHLAPGVYFVRRQDTGESSRLVLVE